jgi:hypothetical protein
MILGFFKFNTMYVRFGLENIIREATYLGEQYINCSKSTSI